jgi:hypothetical protein
MRIHDTSCYRVIDKTREGRIRKVRIAVQGHPEYRIQGRQIIPSDNANAVSHEKLVSAEGVSERNYYESYKVMIQGAGGRQIFKQDHVRSNRSKRGASLAAIVPAGLFSNGDYTAGRRRWRRRRRRREVTVSSRKEITSPHETELSISHCR